ncbi:protein ALP1-like [Salvia hispanica]|uniref:protein ALP1-like n=1 Tax=Salvia hispanica TaxID=49212 RepID=UPI00200923DF|nr:protein ALP1-like [Salvia hispanica]
MDSDDENFRRAIDEEFEELVAAVQAEANEEEAALAAAAAIPRPRYHRRYINHDHAGADQRLMEDYFGDNPRYPPEIFRRRFRMSQRLFIHIADCLSQRYMCFTLRSDATGRPGLSTYQKCTMAIKQLAYVGPADMFDEYLHMGETTALKTLRQFCKGIKEIFKGEYLRKPTAEECQRLINMHGTVHHFPGIMGSIDCMHWEWRNCPVAWKGSNNDINVLQSSHLFNDESRGEGPQISFVANGTQYNRAYYLADGIYPRWPVFVKTIRQPVGPKQTYFAKKQEGARKDVERAFGVLQSRWAIIRCPVRLWHENDVADIMTACIILHNMIIEDEDFVAERWAPEDGASTIHDIATPPLQMGVPCSNEYLIQRFTNMRSEISHSALQADLVEEV